MNEYEFFVVEHVEPLADRADGAPDGYWQVYNDDCGPFVFPLPSAYITKRLVPPASVEGKIWALGLKGIQWQMAFGLLALSSGIPWLAVPGMVVNLRCIYGVLSLVAVLPNWSTRLIHGASLLLLL